MTLIGGQHLKNAVAYFKVTGDILMKLQNFVIVSFQITVNNYYYDIQLYILTLSTCPPFCWGWGGGGFEPPTKFSKRGGLTGPQLWEGVAGKEGITFFKGVAIFTKKK